jgi:hypothetical protein
VKIEVVLQLANEDKLTHFGHSQTQRAVHSLSKAGGIEQAEQTLLQQRTKKWYTNKECAASPSKDKLDIGASGTYQQSQARQ